eukprot:TRINITY_DN428_c0_g1_i4.p1 TRINITY_DN428_c0_g1~~TRINITY_DN428_c0_g1_i4.p1  ORF type:complete len:275 (-),score=30.15 TRINITY_DN428_c0_g1_i4:94-918(-)
MSFLQLLSIILLTFGTFCRTTVAITDADILNFALNLEYLEAEFYSWAAYGRGLNATLRGGGPASIGGKKALLSPVAQALAQDIADDEIGHVIFLRSALGAKAVPAPLINIGTAFAAAANAAIGARLNPSFTPYGDDVVFYHGAYIFEDVGVTAYKGAAALITDKGVLTAAAGILAVEAYHAGAVRATLYAIADQYVFPFNAQVKTIIGAISNLRATVSGVPDMGIVVNGTLQLVATDGSYGAYSRTPAEVLSIVYLGGKGRGGFYPRGLNGNIK